MCCSANHQGHDHAHEAVTYPSEAERMCRCPGKRRTRHAAVITVRNVADVGECCGAITGDDGMCDRCRVHCKGQPA